MLGKCPGVTVLSLLLLPQVLASRTLTSLCASSSGEEGCGYAEQEEIDVLLQALQSPCFAVRDAALRVSTLCALQGLPGALALLLKLFQQGGEQGSA